MSPLSPSAARLPRPRGVVLALLCGLLCLTALVPASAHASAVGYEYFGTRQIGGWTIPSGQLTHVINGSGYHINWDGANYATAGNLCDPSMRFTYGNGAYYINGNVHWGCSHVGQWKYTLNWNAPRGSACAELWTQNRRVMVARQCHYVHG